MTALFEILDKYECSWPTIGSILDFYFKLSVVNPYKSNEYEKTRRKMQRLVREEEGSVNLEEYLEILRDVQRNLESFTVHTDRHWLSGASFHHIVKAYQWLIRNANCFPISSQDRVNQVFFAYFIRWSMEFLFKYLRDDIGRSKYAEDDLWFFPFNEEDRIGSLLMKKLCMVLDCRSQTAYSLCDCISFDRDHGLDSESVERTLQDWFSGQHFPKWSTFQTYFGDLEEHIRIEVFRLFLEASWGDHFQEWMSRSLDDYPKNLQTFLKGIAKDVFSRTKYAPPLLPHLLGPESLEDQDYFERIEKDLFGNSTESQENQIRLLMLLSDAIAIAQEASDIKNLFKIGVEHRYSLGILADDALRSAYSLLLTTQDPNLDRIHKIRFMRGELTERAIFSRNWRAVQANPHPLVIDGENLWWKAEPLIRTANVVKKHGRYLRSSLCIAVERMDFELVAKLLEFGADPFFISRDVAKKGWGDDSSVLLLALQSLHNKESEKIKMWRLLLDVMQKKQPKLIPQTINQRTRILGISAFSQAILFGNPEIVLDCIQNGGDPNAPLGGDDESPLYFAIGQYYWALLASQDKFLGHALANGSNVNPSRMTCHIVVQELEDIFKTIGFPIDEISSLDVCTTQTIQNRMKIVEMLLGDMKCNPNQVQALNGWYPLDLATEIQINTGDSTILETLKSYGAKKAVVF